MEQETVAVEPKGKNFLAKWFGMYFSPSETFQSIDEKPDWVLPLLLLALLTVVSILAITPMLKDVQIEAMMNRGMTEDQAYEALERMPSFMKYLNPIFGAVGLLIVSFILAGIYYLVFNFIMGGESTYKKVLSVYAYSAFAVGLVGTIVRLPLIFAKNSIKVQTSLAAFLPADMEEQLLYKFFAKLDIFVAWQMFLLIVGFGVIYKFSRSKAATGVLSLWALYIVISVLLGNIFGGFGG